MSLQAFAGRKLLSLDWDSRWLRVVQAVSQRGRVRGVQTVCVAMPAELDRSDPAAMGPFVRATLREHKLNARRLLIDVPRDQAILNTLTLPSGTEAELPAAVHFQIVKELPFALDQAVVDFAVSGSDDETNSVEVLVAAVRNDVLAFYQQMAEHAGLDLERVGLRPYANLVSVAHVQADIQSGRTVLVDVGPSLTEIDVIRDGRLVFSRAASVSVPAVGEAPATGRDAGEAGTAADLLLEVTRSLEAYRVTDPGVRIDRIVVAGATGVEEHLATALGRRFSLEAMLYDPGEPFTGQGETHVLRGFSAAIGLIVGHGQPGKVYFDFLNPKKPIDWSAARARKIRMAALGAAAVLAAVVVGANRYLGQRRAVLEGVQQQVKQFEQEVAEFEDFKKQVEAALTWQREEVIWLEHLKRLAELFPDNKQAYATNLGMSSTGRISVDLRMARTDVSTGLAERALKHGYRAVPGSATERGTGDRYPATGSLRIELPEGGGSNAPRLSEDPDTETGPARKDEPEDTAPDASMPEDGQDEVSIESDTPGQSPARRARNSG
ncbi:MAG TPA: pilus assembly protein PilM [Phycisphaerae bacterium]|nr:pilus assembly protein PilM [Phycisphaerae bacterium]